MNKSKTNKADVTDTNIGNLGEWGYAEPLWIIMTNNNTESYEYNQIPTPKWLQDDRSNEIAQKDQCSVLSYVTSVVESRKNKAQLYWEEDKLFEAYGILSIILITKPDDPVILNNLGVCYETLDLYNRAISLYRRALIAQCDNWVITYNLALCHFNDGTWASSLEYFLKANDLKPGCSEILYRVAMACGMTGDWERAVKFFDKTLKVQQDSPLVPLMLAQVVEMRAQAVERISTNVTRSGESDANQDQTIDSDTTESTRL